MDADEAIRVGDKVVYSNHWRNDRIETVDKVTPTGRILINKTYFDKFGREIGNTGSFSYRDRIRKATEEDIKEIGRVEFVRGLNERIKNMKTMTYEQAIAINAILEGGMSE